MKFQSELLQPLPKIPQEPVCLGLVLETQDRVPGRELAANYEVSNLGSERIESQDSVHLELTPKAADVLKQLTRVDLLDFGEN
jgi:hypothetical protein